MHELLFRDEAEVGGQQPDLQGRDVLDFGCGSGILAVAALLLAAAFSPQALAQSWVARHVVTAPTDEEVEWSRKIIDAFACHAAWHRVFEAARKLWAIGALLSNKSKNRDVLSHRYGYYATAIAVYMNDTRLMPPLELFEGLAGTAPLVPAMRR